MTKRVWNRRRLQKAAGAAVIAAASLTGLIGFAHTPAGRPLLNALRGAPGCPVDLNGGDPQTIETARVAALQTLRGPSRERARPALGFELGRTTRSEVERRLRALGAECKAAREESVLRCTEVAPALSNVPSPSITDLHLQFDLEGRLVAVDLFRAATDVEAALVALGALEQELSGAVGPATKQYGERDAHQLSAGPYHLTATQFQYESYVAELSATNVGAEGIRLREQYQYAPRQPIRRASVARL